MKIKAPITFSGRDETRYLTHCKNIAYILAHADSVRHGKAKIEEYLKVTDVKEVEK